MKEYIRKNAVLLILGICIAGGYALSTFGGKKICDCAKTETYRDGSTRRSGSGGIGYTRFYHK